MTREEAKELLPIIKAFAEGKQIQSRNIKSHNFLERVWMDDTGPEFFDSNNEYCIKAESKYRPFKNAEECWNEMQKHQPIGWVKATANNIRRARHLYVLITNLEINIMRLSGVDEEKIDDAFELYTFADGTPFGIKEEE